MQHARLHAARTQTKSIKLQQRALKQHQNAEEAVKWKLGSCRAKQLQRRRGQCVGRKGDSLNNLGLLHGC